MAPEIRFNAFGIPYLVEFANVTFRSHSRAGSTSDSSSVKTPWLERKPSRQLRHSPSVATFESDWTFATASSETLHGYVHSKKSSATLRPRRSTSPSPCPSGSQSSAPRAFTVKPKQIPQPWPAPTQTQIPQPWPLPPQKQKPQPLPVPSLSPSLMSKPLPAITVEEEIETEGEGLLIRFASMAPGKLSPRRLARLKFRIARAVRAAGMDSSPAVGDAHVPNPLDRASIMSEDALTHGVPDTLHKGTYGQVMAALEGAGLTRTPCKASGVQDATYLGVLFLVHQHENGVVEFRKTTLWG